MSGTNNKTEIPEIGDFVKFQTPYMTWTDDVSRPGPFSYGVIKSTYYLYNKAKERLGHVRIICSDGTIVEGRKFDSIIILAKARSNNEK